MAFTRFLIENRERYNAPRMVRSGAAGNCIARIELRLADKPVGELGRVLKSRFNLFVQVFFGGFLRLFARGVLVYAASVRPALFASVTRVGSFVLQATQRFGPQGLTKFRVDLGLFGALLLIELRCPCCAQARGWPSMATRATQAPMPGEHTDV